MPSLPRIRRTRPRGVAEVVERPRVELAELEAAGLTWIHVTAPDQTTAAELAERFGWHALDIEDVLSTRERPKIDDYPDYLFGVLHFPFYDKSIQRLNAVLRILTIFSVVMLPLTLITGLFGMNVKFPGFEQHGSFWIVVAVMAIVGIGEIAFFKYKRWL